MNFKLAWNIFLVYITFLAPVKLLIAGKPSQGDVSRGAEKQARAKTKLPFPGLFPHHHHPVSFNFQNRKTGQNRRKQVGKNEDASIRGLIPTVPSGLINIHFPTRFCFTPVQICCQYSASCWTQGSSLTGSGLERNISSNWKTKILETEINCCL